MDKLHTAVTDMASTFSRLGTAEGAEHLSCTEVDALVKVLTTAGFPELAASFIGVHTDTDDEGDAHFGLTDPEIRDYIKSL